MKIIFMQPNKKKGIAYDPTRYDGTPSPPPTYNDVVLFNDNAGKTITNSGNKLPYNGRLEFIIHGYGAVPKVGVFSDFVIPYNLTITSWTLLANRSGSVVLDIWKDTYANHPPTIADTIVGSAKPTLSSATKATSSTLTGWTTALNKDEIIRINVDSSSTLSKVTFTLNFTRR